MVENAVLLKAFWNASKYETSTSSFCSVQDPPNRLVSFEYGISHHPSVVDSVYKCSNITILRKACGWKPNNSSDFPRHIIVVAVGIASVFATITPHWRPRFRNDSQRRRTDQSGGGTAAGKPRHRP